MATKRLHAAGDLSGHFWPFFCLLLVILVWPLPGQARSALAGSSTLGVLAGPSFSLGKALGTSTAYGSLGLQAEYIFDPAISAAIDVIGSWGTDIDVRLHAGPRLRLAGNGGPFVPFVQAQVVLGRLFSVLGANLQFYGGRVGAGAEYYVLKDVALAAQVAADLGSTAGERPAFFGVTELLFSVAWSM